MNILEVMADPELFGKQFKPGVLLDTWKPWRAFLTALFALPMDEETLELFRAHTGRTDASARAFNEAFVIVGRRGGKSIIAAAVAVFLACFKNYSDVLAPGEVGVLMVIASDRRQARTIMGYIRALIAGNVLLAQMIVAETKESITLNNCVVIEIHTCSYSTTRGYTLIGVIADEVAFWSTEDSANPDVEVLNALRPGLATTNGLLLAISSPYSRRGELWRNYRLHFGKDSDVLVWKGSSREMNPSLSRAVVAAAYQRDPQSAKSEYGAEFRDDVSGFLSHEMIEACVQTGRHELSPIEGVDYFAFCDPSGGQSDSFTLAIGHQEKGKGVLDVLREVKAPFSPEVVVEEFADGLKRYKVFEIEGDRYAGEWPRSNLRSEGLATAQRKTTRVRFFWKCCRCS